MDPVLLVLRIWKGDYARNSRRGFADLVESRR
jgi:hypothetical protein